MTILLSELYGKEIITNSGRKIGLVEDLILDFEEGNVSSLLLTKVDNLVRSQHTALQLAKNSVKYGRVRSVSETIIVGEESKIK
ncbi:MAG: PRC-barrel domain-containing protein [Candidatus Micrarchaeota archaeon]|nr:PRC-barrel domain-containing protein [Candidatus Micrarchaeota archaeon]